MSNASLKEQLQAVASQLSDTAGQRPQKTEKKFRPQENAKKVNKPKPKWLEYVQYGVELLKAYFPESFCEMNNVKPLKKGIKQDLVIRLSTLENVVTEDKACMVKSLAYYVNTVAYHKSVIEGAVRIDLDGTPAGVVSAEEATYSQERQQAKQVKKLTTQTATQQPINQTVTS